MKKALFAAFAGVCVLFSIMATTAKPFHREYSKNEINQMMSDTTPTKKSGKHHKSDTSSYPGRDTTMPKAK